LQGTQNHDTKPTLQRAKNANAHAHPPPSGRTPYHQYLKHHQETVIISLSTQVEKSFIKKVVIKYLTHYI